MFRPWERLSLGDWHRNSLPATLSRLAFIPKQHKKRDNRDEVYRPTTISKIRLSHEHLFVFQFHHTPHDICHVINRNCRAHARRLSLIYSLRVIRDVELITLTHTTAPPTRYPLFPIRIAQQYSFLWPLSILRPLFSFYYTYFTWNLSHSLVIFIEFYDRFTILDHQRLFALHFSLYCYHLSLMQIFHVEHICLLNSTAFGAL